MEIPFLQSKLSAPAVSSQAVPRPDLVARLDEAFEARCKLALVSAPAGYGKTSLVASWLKGAAAARPDLHAAWLTLEAADDDPARFWGYSLASLKAIGPAVGARAQTLLQPGQPLQMELLLRLLLADLDQVQGPVIWVLDDLQAIQSPEIYRSLAFLIDHLPAHAHLVMATRCDPFLPLPRWRAGGELIELRLADEAIAYALAAHEYEEAIKSLLDVGISRILNGEAAAILAICRALPAAWAESHPGLLVLQAWATLALGQFNQVEPYVKKIVAVLPGLPEGSPDRQVLAGQLAVIRASAAFNLRDVETAIEQAGVALELLPETEKMARSVVMLGLAEALLSQGQMEPARQRYLETAQLAHQAGNRLEEINSYSMAGRALAWQGRLHQAQALYNQALQAAQDAGLSELPVVGLAEDGLAGLFIEWNDLAQARGWIEKSLAHFKVWGQAEHTFQAMLTDVDCHQAAGQLDEARAVLVDALALAHKHQLTREMKRAQAAAAALFWQMGQPEQTLQALLAAGLLEETGQVEAPYRPVSRIHPHMVNQIPTVLLLLDQRGEYAPVQEWLEGWLDKAEFSGFQRQAILLLVVQALLNDRHKNRKDALEQIDRAIRLAEPEGLVRTFTQVGAGLADLIGAWLRHKPLSDSLKVYAGRLLEAAQVLPAALPQPPHPVAAAMEGVLSERELEVLRLAAAGMINDEIARALVISSNTVRTHLKRIFDKLGVNSRRAAAEQAHLRKLI